MSVTTKATVEVRTVDFRNALKAVYPHRNRVKTGDAASENRVRMVFSAGVLFLMATNNGNTCALAKIKIQEDSRGALGKLDPDDGPMTVDLAPARVPLLLQAFKLGANDSDVDQALKFDIDLNPNDRCLDVTDIGGLFEGQSVRYPLDDPAEAFPDVLGIIGQALAAASGAAAASKELLQDGKIVALFKDASVAYSAPLAFEPIGTGDSRGFLVRCGPDFIGTVQSRHADDDSLIRRRDAERLAWMGLLPAKLRAV